MVDHVIDTNVVSVVGKVVGEKTFSHEIYGEGFYTYHIEVPRLSDITDTLPLTISDRLLVDMDLIPGDLVKIEGQLRSYNKFMDGNNRLILTVFVREIEKIDDMGSYKNPNQIELEGFICKEPVYRETPFGREITDLLVAVNRPYNKSDYIPCIAWGRNARFSSKLNVGDQVKTWGRIQSRQYQKKLNDGRVIDKVAYEVSISKMEKVEKENVEEIV
ncbi:single-stranded DNA-binding protein [Serpentinicella sp. ANB-PHB4]|uniref:single-stranded DNA-binding protein n=1 Tax=Serpentinicella sp. ANB-PHB4 TaxID=3074076 RepID=UPI0028679742|nr:single-stranded DNA-binding protein [Serpentinicella sp. ANB-PHB4]MDR5659381.1 single-stranded DNA-binding protein [Serpentinicella sp. ANB-PHB4]